VTPKDVRWLAATVAALAVLRASSPAGAAPADAPVPVVAAENFYGDIAGQLGGAHVAVTSIITDPNVDPHEYISNARDAAAVARARLVIQNGLGYDAFLDRLMAASPNPSRRLIVVARLTGHRQGDNVHLWYAPATAPALAAALLEALAGMDPAGAASFRSRHRAFLASLRPLHRAVAAIKAQYAGTPIAVTEPVFAYMADALGLKVLTPGAFQKAIEEGQDPPAAARARMEDQLEKHEVKLLVYNLQTVSPITARVQALAKRAGVPVVGVSETEPPGTAFQQWMLAQLDALRAALGGGR
jgi:zinc/manganese transport system substrate-binding protein